MDSPATLMDRALSTLRRVVIEGVEPEVDGGKFPIKRCLGDRVRVQADIFADGHDLLGARLLSRRADDSEWREAAMRLIENDRWEGEFEVEDLGRYLYTIIGWVDAYGTWAADLAKKANAGVEISVDVLRGVELLQSAAARAKGADRQELAYAVERLRELSEGNSKAVVEFAQSGELEELTTRNRDFSEDTRYEKDLVVVVDPVRARFGAWYEMFPRSCTTDSKRLGTLRDCSARLGYVSAMGFDILYLPPIHPIGLTERKGKNNSLVPTVGDVGSPWAIGGAEGGHKSIHPHLGTLQDLKDLRNKARELGLEVALDIAFQCSPDHPYVKEHREWFCERPDGTVQYAENPPKKYQDIYPFDFESKHAPELWEELKSIVVYWAEQGIRIFRVDNPHTKPFVFWEWLIREVKRDYPDVVLLSEAFTRPKVMYRLAKLGFTQSYTYFAWKNTSAELIEYFTELTHTPVREFFRPNVWPNTPDILNEYLQKGGRPAFAARFILASTLGASYGIYGPAFELYENRPIHAGSEEYLNSEKYEVRVWDTDNPNSLKDLITRVNAIRKASPALRGDWSLRFHPVDNEQLIAYSKVSEDFSDMILVVVNLDPHKTQAGWISVVLKELKLGDDEAYQVHDLLTGARYVWRGSRNFVQLDPSILPAHIFRVHPIG
ncbi:MAG TPA: alpha-1,4-glucan--maltose-1-phosphate maltosyltransferase [Candidatus Acidoferrum sp.]|nr:alpha-1,4-glucan--maltose-1-phosphate maltosyltransferase [Candidatus Acidoferrum sp.]